LIRTLQILTLFMTLSFVGHSQGGAEEANLKLKSMFVYSFIKNVQWPAGKDNVQYTIGILGDKALYQKMNASYAGKEFNGHKLVFEYYDSFSTSGKCHVIYVDPSQSDKLSENISTLKKNKTLIVTEKGGLLFDGSVINFVIANNKLRFEISNTNAQKVPLVIGPALIKMATNVI
jgi:Fe-S cluster assembly iron-binding protein IscA